jgi:hypothetical protein
MMSLAMNSNKYKLDEQISGFTARSNIRISAQAELIDSIRWKCHAEVTNSAFLARLYC